MFERKACSDRTLAGKAASTRIDSLIGGLQVMAGVGNRPEEVPINGAWIEQVGLLDPKLVEACSSC